MEVNMSQLGYLYSVATRQYQKHTVTVAYSSKENQIDPALDGVRNFISPKNYSVSRMSSSAPALFKIAS